MATPFIPLPSEAFPEAARPSIERLNIFLLELSRLEGTIRQPIESRRSDQSVARRSTVQVDISRITPSVASVVSGASTVVATPALTFGLTNTVGSTSSAVSANSAIALFNANAPPAVDAGSGLAGLSSTAANLGHRHQVLTAIPTVGYTTTAGLTGSATTLLRSDATLLAPTFLRSSANNSTLALTDDATDQTLTGNLGVLNIVPGTGIDIDFPNSAAASLIIKPNTTTAADNVVSVQGRPVAGTRALILPNWFAPGAAAVFSSQTFKCWDAQFPLFSGQHTSSTIVGYDASTLTMLPSSGSTGGNNLYAFRNSAFSINNATGAWSNVAAAYFRGVRRVITSPFIDVQATIIVEPPTAGLSASNITLGSSQIGIYIRQQAAQATAADRIAIKVDAQNSGTNRYAFYGVSDTLYHGGRVQHTGVQFGIYGATPTVQFGTTGTASGFATGTSTAVTVDSTYTGNTGSLAYTIGDVILSLKMLGVLAT